MILGQYCAIEVLKKCKEFETKEEIESYCQYMTLSKKNCGNCEGKTFHIETEAYSKCSICNNSKNNEQ